MKNFKVTLLPLENDEFECTFIFDRGDSGQLYAFGDVFCCNDPSLVFESVGVCDVTEDDDVDV